MQYDVVIVTGSVDHAGTDANISIVLFGDKVNIILLFSKTTDHLTGR
jgi:hypothetical protein